MQLQLFLMKPVGYHDAGGLHTIILKNQKPIYKRIKNLTFKMPHELAKFTFATLKTDVCSLKIVH